MTDDLHKTMLLGDLEKAILDIVREFQGIKATQLAAEIVPYCMNNGISVDFSGEKVLEAIRFLVERNQLIEIEYVLPDMDYRIKSFLLPRGTEVRLLQPNFLEAEDLEEAKKRLEEAKSSPGTLTLDELKGQITRPIGEGE